MVRVSEALLLAIPCGLALGLGLWSLLALVPRFSAPALQRRVAPYVTDLSPEARALGGVRPEPAGAIGGLLAPLGRGAGRAIASVLGGDATVAARLRQSGRGGDVRRFRARQAAWCGVALAAGLAVAALAARQGAPAVAVVVIPVVIAALGLLAPEQLLAARARARQRRLAEELPTVLEFLTLALTAGEGVAEAVRRVARVGSGELARELAHVVAESNSGVPLATALTRCAAELELPAFTRTVDQLVGAMERGAPLAEVLRAQAADVRAEAKRDLLEAAGRKEVTMLVPLVFLILPVTIAFALWPAVLVLRVGF
ncbi:MAG: type II secretion system F family protein [Actinomycetales bacterium]|nr:type II secretion system F family protein [Actinomycetales bacterium]